MMGRMRFLSALQCEKIDRPPVWLMRQAGRVLPEYRALREKYSFLSMTHSPKLCAEITLQPILRFGFDAAILFADILSLHEALGQGYNFTSENGIRMDFQITPENFCKYLVPPLKKENLTYLVEAMGIIKDELKGETAFLGFAGSPWTLACFMMEGSSPSSDSVLRPLDWYHNNPVQFDHFMSLLSERVIDYLLLQWEQGIDAAQIFDSLSHLVPEEDYWNVSGKYIALILERLGIERNMIVYCKGRVWRHFISIPVKVLSVDWKQSLVEVKKEVGIMRCVQGNISPELMKGDPSEVYENVLSLRKNMLDENGFILNLGHGLLPDSKLECIEALLDAAKAEI